MLIIGHVPAVAAAEHHAGAPVLPDAAVRPPFILYYTITILYYTIL